VDPALNINDPNNTATDVGGALIVDLSPAGVTMGGMGVITPQTNTTAADFSGNYAAGEGLRPTRTVSCVFGSATGERCGSRDRSDPQQR
jgi:hypothetical protein